MGVGKLTEKQDKVDGIKDDVKNLKKQYEEMKSDSIYLNTHLNHFLFI